MSTGQLTNGSRLDELARLDRAQRALELATTVAEMKAVREEAESVRLWARQTGLGLEVQNSASELKLQAERRVGNLLLEMKLRGGDRRSGTRDDFLNLRQLGIDKNQSARWQLEATIPEELFRRFVQATQMAGREISSAALIRLAKRLRDEPGATAAELLTGELEGASDGPLHMNWTSADVVHQDVEHLSDVVLEIQNHHEVLSHIVESLCERAAIEPQEVERRAAQRYLREIHCHLQLVGKGLRRLAREQHLYVSLLTVGEATAPANP